jgi:hypothetical protein
LCRNAEIKETSVKTLVLGVLMSVVAVAAAAHTDSPYMGQETHDIKALSPQDIDAICTAEGWGMPKRPN